MYLETKVSSYCTLTAILLLIKHMISSVTNDAIVRTEHGINTQEPNCLFGSLNILVMFSPLCLSNKPFTQPLSTNHPWDRCEEYLN